MDKKVLALLLLVAALSSVSGCSKPEVKKVTMHWGTVNSSVTQIISNVTVTDPLPFSIPLSGVNVKIYMNGIEMGTGHSVGRASIFPPESNIKLVIDLINSRLVDWWVTHIRNGERTTVKIVSDLEFSIFGLKFGVPVTRVSEFRTNFLSIPPAKSVGIYVAGLKVGEVKDVKLRWGDVTHGSTQVIATATVVNDLPVPLYLNYLEYNIYMNGIKMGSGRIASTKIIKPKSQERVEFTMYIDNSKIPEWWVTHIRNGERTTVKVEMGVGMTIRGKSVFVPLNSYTYTIQTHILQSPVG